MPPEQQIQAQNQFVNIPASQSQISYAGFWMRYLARSLDYLIISIVIIIPLNIVAMVAGTSTVVNVVVFLLQTLLAYTYFIYLTNRNQATIGKKLLGLRVVLEDGTRLSLGKIAFRETIGKFISFIILCIGYLMVAFTAKKQGLHDKMVGSVVLSNRSERKTWAFVVSIIIASSLPAIAIIGILASVTLTSLNTARARVIDTSIKTDLDNIRAQSALVYDINNNYETICSNPVIAQAFAHAESVINEKGTCNASTSGYAVYVPLKAPTIPNTGWCVDSTMISRESVGPGTATVCP